MPDLEKVVYALKCHTSDEYPLCSECKYPCREDDTITIPIELAKDALTLLKSQELMVDDKSQEVISGFTLYCPNCGFANTCWGTISPQKNTVFYCGKCGMEVKWE